MGPHRDDVAIALSGMTARSFASQGQQRSIVLALKLAEAAVLALSCGEEPVVFLDDVLSELDAGRQEYLLRTLGGRQVFLTGCGTIPPAGERGEFHVSQGAVSREDAARP